MLTGACLGSAPEILEPVRRKLSIAHRALDVAVSKVRLQRPRVVPRISQGKPASVTKHVRVRLEVEAGFRAGTLDNLREAARRERRPALAHEHERRCRALAR
jgi:hypothetical protein